MAIAKFKKIHLIAHRALREILLSDLQHLGGVHIVNWYESNPEERPSAKPENLYKIEDSLSKIEYCLKFIAPYEKSLSFIEKLSTPKPKVNLAKLKELEGQFPFLQIYDQCVEIEREIHELNQRKIHLETQIEHLAPWEPLKLPLSEIKDTQTALIYACKIKIEQHPPFQEKIKEELNGFFELEEVNRRGDFIYFIIIALLENRPLLDSLLLEFEAERVNLIDENLTPGQLLKNDREESSQIDILHNQRLEKSKEFLQYKQNLELLFDLYFNQKKQIEIESNIYNTQSALIIEGWAQADNIEGIKNHIETNFSEIDLSFRDPAENEDPPVDLTNAGLVSPFETITKLYSLPVPGGIDPTPLLAPFFFIFFGLCMADVGYGILMMGVTWFALNKFLLPEGAKRLVKLFFLVGIATLIAGLLMGSWFGDMVDLLPPLFAPLKTIKNSIMIFDPIKDPLTFLILSVSLGFFQVIFGIIVKLYMEIKNKAYADAFMVRVPWIILLLGMGMLGMSFSPAFSGELFKKTAEAMFYGGMIAILIISAHGVRNPLIRLWKGFLELYSIIGYCSDMLSYSRLLALGLASAIIAMVVNKMALLTLDIPFVGIIFMLLIMAGGHLFNLAINLLGAFVHCSRLQFIEFFSKFFDGGGREFVPFVWEGKYTIYEKD